MSSITNGKNYTDIYRDNSAHTFGWYGLWIHKYPEGYFPRVRKLLTIFLETNLSVTPLFSEGLSLKLDETLNTLWGVKEDPHGTPKSQRKRYFTEKFLLPIFTGI